MPASHHIISRAGLLLAALAATLVLGACGSKPTVVAPAPLVSTVPTLEQFMSDAARARQEGARASERDIYRKAAQAYPTSKEPWLKLAEGYFEAADYGNAILAAQEVLQRDAADKVGTSLLAVSGLRVSTAALASLRQGQNLNADTRRQAEDVVKSLRDVLGEPVLVPKPTESAVADKPAQPAQPTRRPAPPPPVRPRPAAPATAAAPAPAPAVMPTAAPAPAPAKKAPNPFDTLK
jgi:hypothetical protein